MKATVFFFALLMGMMTFQVIHYLEFNEQVRKWINKGARFTASDGQALCERIQKLEHEPKPCRFVK